MALQHLRSNTANKRPNPTAMAEGQLALNTANASPGLFYKDATGSLIKAGPVHIGATAPNATPAVGGHAGNSVGEAWLDTSGTNALLKIYNGAAFVTVQPVVNGTVVSTADTGTVTSTMILDGTILNADINASAAIVDTKLATIATGGKVSNSATTATNANTASAIVARDASGNFTAGTITAALTGAASSNVLKAGDTMTGALVVPLASAATPSLTFTGDLNTGIFSPGADQVAISTNGTGRLFVDSAGFTGIGTSDPATVGRSSFRNLVISGTGNRGITINSGSGSSGGLVFNDTDGGFQGGITYLHTNDSMQVQVNSAERLRITSAGNVGIGTSTPSTLLHLSGTATTAIARIANVNSSSASFNGSGAGLELLAASANTTNKYTPAIKFGSTDPDFTTTNPKFGAAIIAEAAQVYSTDTTGGMDLTFWTAPVSPGTGNGLVERARIDSSGRLLVGTSSASGANLLQVNSDALVNGLTVGRGAGGISSNTAVGTSALVSNTTGNSNTANGFQALRDNTTGINNTANGVSALRENTTGSSNTANGFQALRDNTTGFNNTANGVNALRDNTTGSSNTANGFQALRDNTTGINNTANGRDALRDNTTGDSNTANGKDALKSNTTGGSNTCYGTEAGKNLTTGSNNTIIGRILGTAGLTNTVIIGAGATERLRIDSSGNVGIGTSAPAQLLHVQGSEATIRIDNLAAGANVYGDLINAVGGTTTLRARGGASTHGSISLNTWNGTDDLPRLFVSSTGNVGIGTTSPANQLQLSTDSAGKPSTNTWTIVSDERIKEEIELADLDLCYAAVKNIPLKRFKWKDEVYTEEQVRDRRKLGWIAQDVEAVFPKAVGTNEFKYNQVFEETIVSAVEEELDDEGNVTTPAQPERIEKGELISEDVIEDCRDLNSDQLYAAMYGAIQKLMIKVEALETEVAALKAA